MRPERRQSPPRGQQRGARRERQGERLRLDAILPYFPRAVRQRDGSYLVNCPCHDDEHPSLHISESPDGGILVHCFGGCPQDVLWHELLHLAGRDTSRREHSEPAGLTLAELARAKMLDTNLLRAWGVEQVVYSGRPALKIPYLSETGELLCTQYRLAVSGANRFRMEGSPTVYGLWRLNEFTGETLWITEGTSDCWCLWHAGIPALALPSASPSRECLERLWTAAERFRTVYLLTDNDEAGRQAITKLAESCPESLRERVKGVQLPSDTKDVGELWLAYGGDPQAFRQQLQEAVRQAQPLPERAEREASSSGEEGFVITPVHYKNLERDVADPLVQGLLYSGRLCLLAGTPGVGKTVFALQLVNSVSTGEPLWGQPVMKVPTLWLDFDDPFPRLAEILDAYYGEKEREIYLLPEEQRYPLGYETFYAYKRVIEQLGVRLVVVDTIQQWVEIADENDGTEVREKMELVRRLARETGVSILATCHTSKQAEYASNPLATAVGGHTRWAASADAVSLLKFASENGIDAVRLIVPKLRDGFRWEAKFERRNFQFIPLTETLPKNEWYIVKQYLQQVGEASYAELHAKLRSEGFVMTESALQKKIKRWEQRGMVVVRKKDFPAKAFVALPTIHIILPNHEQDGQDGHTTPSTVHAVHAVQTVHPEGTEEEAQHGLHGQYRLHGHMTLSSVHAVQTVQTDEPETEGEPQYRLHGQHGQHGQFGHTPSQGVQTDDPSREQEPTRLRACPECGSERVYPESDGGCFCYLCRKRWNPDGSRYVPPPPPEKHTPSASEPPSGFSRITEARWELELFLQQAQNDEYFPITFREAEAVREVWKKVSAKGFPALNVAPYAFVEEGWNRGSHSSRTPQEPLPLNSRFTFWTGTVHRPRH